MHLFIAQTLTTACSFHIELASYLPRPKHGGTMELIWINPILPRYIFYKIETLQVKHSLQSLYLIDIGITLQSICFALL